MAEGQRCNGGRTCCGNGEYQRSPLPGIDLTAFGYQLSAISQNSNTRWLIAQFPSYLGFIRNLPV
jgi:hypothetical protein